MPGVIDRRGGERPAACVHAIEYSLGEQRLIDDLDFLRDNKARLELYRSAGFVHYVESGLSMRELAFDSARRTLQGCGLAGTEIDTCLYVAESFDRDEVVNSQEVNRLLVDLGIENAVPIHLSSSNCANIVAALRMATAMIEADQAAHVLVVSVDKAPSRYGGRKMFQEMSIKSDVSLSCVVSRGEIGCYRVLYVGQHNAAALACGEIPDSAAYSVPKFKGIRHAARRAKETLGMTASDFTRVITNNYSREVSKMFTELCGFRKEAGWFDNIARFAHAVAGDVLVNLQDLHLSGGIRPGDRLFLMADSVAASTVVCLQAQ